MIAPSPLSRQVKEPEPWLGEPGLVEGEGMWLCQVGFSTEETPQFIFPEIIGRPRNVWKA